MRALDEVLLGAVLVTASNYRHGEYMKSCMFPLRSIREMGIPE